VLFIPAITKDKNRVPAASLIVWLPV